MEIGNTFKPSIARKIGPISLDAQRRRLERHVGWPNRKEGRLSMLPLAVTTLNRIRMNPPTQYMPQANGANIRALIPFVEPSVERKTDHCGTTEADRYSRHPLKRGNKPSDQEREHAKEEQRIISRPYSENTTADTCPSEDAGNAKKQE